MAYSPPDEIILPSSAGAATGRPERSRAAAFVPITVALVGIAAILFGQVSAGDRPSVDPTVTGSIHPAPTDGEHAANGR